MRPKIRCFNRSKIRSAVAALPVCALAVHAFATDIIGVLPAALDQPRINATLSAAPLSPTSFPYYADFGGVKSLNIQAYLDTGASGVLLSAETATALNGTVSETGIPQQQYNGQPVHYEDVGAVGTQQFNVSAPLYISLAKFHPDTDQKIADAEDTLSNNNPTSFDGVDLNFYNQHFGPIRTQITQAPQQIGDEEANQNPLLSDLDVFGMPVMKGKVVVMDPKPLDNLTDTMRTYLYDKTETQHTATLDTDPGIVKTTRSVKLSYASFDQFSLVTPSGAPGPNLEHNPFIGKNPITGANASTPGVTITYGNHTASGSFLLDTGAGASMISSALAHSLGLTVDNSDPNNPVIVGVPAADQFQISIAGIGGQKKVAGFYLSSLMIKSFKKNNTPDDLRFIGAPVIINDITARNPTTNQLVTLDGIFGMNFLVGSAAISEGGPLGVSFDGLAGGAFDWVTFDETNGLLNLRPRLPGDANRDGVVDFNDLVALAQHYNNSVSGDTWAQGDFNNDGVVNFSDLVMTAQHYNGSDLNGGESIYLPTIELPQFGSALVPEPSIASSLLAAAAFLTRRPAGRKRFSNRPAQA